MHMAYYHFETEAEKRQEERQRKDKETAKHCKQVFLLTVILLLALMLTGVFAR